MEEQARLLCLLPVYGGTYSSVCWQKGSGVVLRLGMAACAGAEPWNKMVRNMIICGAGLCQYLIDAYPEVRMMLVVAQAHPLPDYAEHLDCQLVGINLSCSAGPAPL